MMTQHEIDAIQWEAGEVEWRYVPSGNGMRLNLVCPQNHYVDCKVNNSATRADPCPSCKELAGLREDKAMLDWIESEKGWCGIQNHLVYKLSFIFRGHSLRQALTTAMEETSDG